MKIAHVTATYPPYQGGTGNVAYHNARCLAELGHEVTVYTAGSDSIGTSRTVADGVRVRRLRALIRIGNAPLIPGLLRVNGYDLVHLHYPFIFGAEMVLAMSRLKRFPFVLTYHNDLISPGLKGSLFSLYERVWARRLMEAAARVIVTSWDGAAASHILGPMIRSHPARFREVPNGVNIRTFRPTAPDRQLAERLGVGNQDGVIVFVGSMDSAHHPKGGVPVLLEAVSRLRDASVLVLLVGGGDKVDAYAAQAAALGLKQQVRFVGTVANDELPSILALADMVVQPSLLFEPFGLVAVEAMACGKPVIVSDLPGVRRVVSDAGGGLLARPGDPDDLAMKIRLLLADPGLRRQLGARGRSGVEARYDWAVIGPQLEMTYREAAAAETGTPGKHG